MHTRIYFILLMMVSISSHARCDGGLHVWPTGDIINTNPILLIENQPFHDGHDLLFNEIGSKHNFYLKSDNALIKLIVVSKYFGSFGFQQVILRPETKLIPNKKYELVLDSLPLKTHKGRKVENATWTTNNKSDNTIPKFKSKPSEVKQFSASTGEGDYFYTIFKCKINDMSPCLIKVSFKNIDSNIKSELIVINSKNRFQIVKDACYGGFDININESYELTFELIDSSGNVNNMNNYRVTLNRQK